MTYSVRAELENILTALASAEAETMKMEVAEALVVPSGGRSSSEGIS